MCNICWHYLDYIMHMTDCSLAWNPSHDLEAILLFDIQHVLQMYAFLIWKLTEINLGFESM